VRSDLDSTTKYWWCVDDLAERYHLAPKTIRVLLAPHRGKCHLGRRGRHPRLLLWAPLEVVRILDRDRRRLQVA
jgi:hypothetical protein